MSEADATTNPVEESKVAETTEEQTTAEVPAPVPAAAETETEIETKVEPSKEAVQEDDKPEEATSNKVEKKKILKTTAQELEDPRQNIKFDPSTRAVTDDPVAIRKQVEFYFGDWNFPQDKFMWESAQGTENKPVELKKIHSFKRMRVFQPYSAVVAALRESDFLDVEGEEDTETVKRKVPYKSAQGAKRDSEAASVYVKGFGDETPTTQFDLESFFADFGTVKAVKLRRTDVGLFKGSVFVTFSDVETAKKFLELDPAPKWKEGDLKIMSKHDYCEEKAVLIREGKLQPNSSGPKFYEGTEGKTRGRGAHRGGPRDNNDWKSRRDNDQKNGFRGGRGGAGGRGRGSGRGRGDRGRGARGGRGRGGDRNFEKKFNSNDTQPHIQSTVEEPKSETNGKRAREDDKPAGEPAAKKVDVKES